MKVVFCINKINPVFKNISFKRIIRVNVHSFQWTESVFLTAFCEHVHVVLLLFCQFKAVVQTRRLWAV